MTESKNLLGTEKTGVASGRPAEEHRSSTSLAQVGLRSGELFLPAFDQPELQGPRTEPLPDLIDDRVPHDDSDDDDDHEREGSGVLTGKHSAEGHGGLAGGARSRQTTPLQRTRESRQGGTPVVRGGPAHGSTDHWSRSRRPAGYSRRRPPPRTEDGQLVSRWNWPSFEVSPAAAHDAERAFTSELLAAR